jgi:hypothetical protein
MAQFPWRLAGPAYYDAACRPNLTRRWVPWKGVVKLALFELDVKSLEKKFTEVRDHL